jgi:hypothetical protein
MPEAAVPTVDSPHPALELIAHPQRGEVDPRRATNSLGG